MSTSPPSNSREILNNLHCLPASLLKPPQVIQKAAKLSPAQGGQAVASLIRLPDGEDSSGQTVNKRGRVYVLKDYKLHPRENLKLESRIFFREGINSYYLRPPSALSDGLIGCVVSEVLGRQTPCFVHVYGFWRDSKTSYILMERLRDNFFQRLEKETPAAREKILALGMYSMVHALALAQNYHFTHYDLHRDNIMSRGRQSGDEFRVWDGGRWIQLADSPYLPVAIDYGHSTISGVNLKFDPTRAITVEANLPTYHDKENGFDPYVDLAWLFSSLMAFPGETSQAFLTAWMPGVQNFDPFFRFNSYQKRYYPSRNIIYGRKMLSPAGLLKPLAEFLLRKGWAQEISQPPPEAPLYFFPAPWRPLFTDSYSSPDGAIEYKKGVLVAMGKEYLVSASRLSRMPGYRLELACCGSSLALEVMSRPGPAVGINGTFFNLRSRMPTHLTVFTGTKKRQEEADPENKGFEVSGEAETPWLVTLDGGPRLHPPETAPRVKEGSRAAFYSNMPLLHRGERLFDEKEMSRVSYFSQKDEIVPAFRYRCTHDRVEDRGIFVRPRSSGPATISCHYIPAGTLFHLAQENPRSVLAWIEDNVCLLSVAGRLEDFPGASVLDLYDILEELPAFFGNKESLREAVNLDGGRSSEIIVGTELGQTVSSKGTIDGMSLGNAIVYSKEEI